MGRRASSQTNGSFATEKEPSQALKISRNKRKTYANFLEAIREELMNCDMIEVTTHRPFLWANISYRLEAPVQGKGNQE
jgi:hypothetical protein